MNRVEQATTASRIKSLSIIVVGDTLSNIDPNFASRAIREAISMIDGSGSPRRGSKRTRSLER